MQINGKSRGVVIPTSAIVAVETDPPLSYSGQSLSDQVERAPYIRIPQFLTVEENRRVFDYAIQHQLNFVASKVVTNEADYRKSMILPKFDELEIDLEGQLREILPEVFTRFGMITPPLVVFEKQLTTHNDGGYFKIHNDNGSPESASRLLTYVYYFQRDLAAFTGGQIRIYDSKVVDNTCVAADTFVDLQPENNMVLLFPSRLLHAVMPIRCPSRQFADGRFTLNGWIRDSAAK
jgi:SM-20-related protein